jgi:two-component sensor histidine kinase/PAS domain-containing protein
MAEVVQSKVQPIEFEDAEQVIHAIHHGDVDAFVVMKGTDPQVVTLAGADEPYRVLVQRMNEGVLTVGSDGCIIFGNDRLSELTGFPTDDLIDRHVATLFGGDPPRLVPDASLEASLLRCDDSQLPVKVWTRPISIGDKSATLVTLTDLSVYRRAEQLAAAERFTRSILEQATNAIIVLAPDGSITHASLMAEDLAEQPPVGRAFSQAFPIEAYNTADTLLERFSPKELDHALATKPFHGVEIKFRSERLSNRVFLLSAGPLLDEKKLSVGSIVTLTEITERKHAEEQQATIASELNHRFKNMLSLVQSLAAQTVRSSETLENFNDAFSGRLQALASAHDLLTQTRPSGIGLSELVTNVLAPFRSRDERIKASGSQIALPADAVVLLAMALHELTTNAVKYGALSNASGHIDIAWRLVEQNGSQVELTWQESGGPTVKRRAAGFGTKLINHALRDLGAETEIRFDPQGLRCTVAFPLQRTSAP